MRGETCVGHATWELYVHVAGVLIKKNTSIHSIEHGDINVIFLNVFIEHAPLLSAVLHTVSIIYMCFTFFCLVLLFVSSPFKHKIKSHLLFAGIISSPFSPR